MKLTSRGWLVLTLFVLSLIVLFNVLMSGRYVDCDLRTQPITDCRLAHYSELPNNNQHGGARNE